MKLLSLLLCMMLAGCGSQFSCGSQRVNTPPAQLPDSPCTGEKIAGRLHPTLSFYVDRFTADARQYGKPCYYTFTIGFITERPPDIGDAAVGYCRRGFEVRVVKSFWDSASATERNVLIYHELGHCALGLDHVDDKPDIMNSYLLDESIADKKWDSLVKTMFERVAE